MDLTFVSGWAGFPALFPDVPGDARFLAPFAGLDEAGVLAGLERGGDLLLAWSTGAHIALKHRERILPRYGRVVLAAPFLHFSSFTPARVLRLMRRALAADPVGTVAAFHAKCGAAPTPLPGDVAPAELDAGLAFLAESSADPAPGVPAAHVLVLHGADDAIVPAEAARSCLEALPGARFLALEGGHFLLFSVLLEAARA
ncbi:alpha/beta hydrolase [Desulfovibrio aminophilus]|nr:alpha/beta hydrolase [Desulfovibrio aminophilus]MCM0756543.1 alpha/beta hydrolase [Desulfovibrio aminophilus]